MLIVDGYEYDLDCADTPWILFLPLSTVFGWTLVLVYLLLCVSPFESSDNWRRRWGFPETNKVISSSLAFCPAVDQLYPSGLIIAVLYSHDPKFVSCIFVLSALFSSTHISFRIIQHGCCGWYATITMITICSVHCQFVFVILFIFVLQYF